MLLSSVVLDLSFRIVFSELMNYLSNLILKFQFRDNSSAFGVH